MKTAFDNKKNYLYLCQHFSNLSHDSSHIFIRNRDDFIYMILFNEINNNTLLSVNTITFGEDFNEKIYNLPKNLKSIIFGKSFNQSVDNLPESLQSIVFGDSFNQSVDKLPQNIQSITFGRSFKQSINNIHPKVITDPLFLESVL